MPATFLAKPSSLYDLVTFSLSHNYLEYFEKTQPKNDVIAAKAKTDLATEKTKVVKPTTQQLKPKTNLIEPEPEKSKENELLVAEPEVNCKN